MFSLSSKLIGMTVLGKKGKSGFTR
uniref:Uncharacterized protein n=1 Tax=Arundo donax TaxID=35708 RepID=A0A0A9E9D1_ARUDO